MFWRRQTCLPPVQIRTPDRPARNLVTTPSTLPRILKHPLLSPTLNMCTIFCIIKQCCDRSTQRVRVLRMAPTRNGGATSLNSMKQFIFLGRKWISICILINACLPSRGNDCVKRHGSRPCIFARGDRQLHLLLLINVGARTSLWATATRSYTKWINTRNLCTEWGNEN
jgi:hypothetical protein